MNKAVVYARYSSDKQSEQSIEGQIAVCQEYARRQNIVIVDCLQLKELLIVQKAF